MLNDYSSSFVRLVVGTPADWRARLPDAIGEHVWEFVDENSARVVLGDESALPHVLVMNWSIIDPVQIALLRLPRMEVSFQYSTNANNALYSFMKRFDLHMQRGGG
ncbi:MAG: hypothetical protein EAZ24_05560 [Burkholderiales bacterium]|nr:MAG: hypothetical protein EAZ24_05560 [Burkholderiales bacterium]TAG81418.1 MAG: hypothetical protein EAZ21_06190 [Betaproteobacteria bacterium]